MLPWKKLGLGDRRLGKAGAPRGPLLSSSPIGRLGMGFGTVVVNTRAGDRHCHWKLVDTEGRGSWLVVIVGPITLDEEIVQGDVGLTMHVEKLNRNWEV